MKSRILIGISGGIAAVKIPQLLKNLIARGIETDVVMTKSAAAIIPPRDFTKITKSRVYTDLFGGGFNLSEILTKRSVEHIDVAQRADLVVIVPATANVIAKLAHGIADDYLTTAVLAATSPVLVCPSMNVFMWNNPATQKNVETLRRNGIHTFGPDSGMLACGYEGEGRLPEVDSIESEIFRFIHRRNSLRGKKIIVTAGGTTEPIDDVRVMTNKSSGKMGAAIAESAYLCGADVVLLRATHAVSPRLGIKEILFDTAADLREKMGQQLPDADICIHAAAVSDFKIKNPVHGKSSSTAPLSLELEPQTKILDSVKSVNPAVFLVAFKAEYDIPSRSLMAIAQKRLEKAGADMIVVNDISIPDSGFGAEYNEVSILSKNGRITRLPRAHKRVIADGIMDEIIRALGLE